MWKSGKLSPILIILYHKIGKNTVNMNIKLTKKTQLSAFFKFVYLV